MKTACQPKLNPRKSRYIHSRTYFFAPNLFSLKYICQLPYPRNSAFHPLLTPKVSVESHYYFLLSTSNDRLIPKKIGESYGSGSK